MPGESFPVSGRSADGVWLQIEHDDGEMGWVAAEFVQVAGDVDSLPVVEASSPPLTIAPTTATESTATQVAASTSGAAVSDLPSASKWHIDD